MKRELDIPIEFSWVDEAGRVRRAIGYLSDARAGILVLSAIIPPDNTPTTVEVAIDGKELEELKRTAKKRLTEVKDLLALSGRPVSSGQDEQRDDYRVAVEFLEVLLTLEP